MLKITNKLIKEYAEKRAWKVEIISEGKGVLRLSTTSGQQVITRSSLSPFSPATSVVLADDKYATYILAKELGIPVIDTHIFETFDQAIALLQRYQRLVIKPFDAAHGNGVTVNVQDRKSAKSAFKAATVFSHAVLVQPMIEGTDIRVLIIGGTLAAASIRRPASVEGDGKHTIQELIEIENTSGSRAPNYQAKSNLIDIEAASRFLGDDLKDVPAENEVVQVVGTANIGTGGTSEDITETINSKIVEDSIKLMRVLGMETGAVDYILSQNGDYHLLEVNANPSFGLHAYPTIGSSRPVADLYLDWLEKKLQATSS